jgi:hypothetical protein
MSQCAPWLYRRCARYDRSGEHLLGPYLKGGAAATLSSTRKAFDMAIHRAIRRWRSVAGMSVSARGLTGI